VKPPESSEIMQRCFLLLALVFSGCRPQDAEYYLYRGSVWTTKDEYAKAIADFNEAIRLAPNCAEAYDGRGIVWQITGEYDKAISDYSRAVQINPKFAHAFNNRGQVWTEKGEYDKAISDHNHALAVSPNYAPAYSALGWLYATCPDGKYRDGRKAFEAARQAYRLTEGRDWDCLDTVAAAYAEAGDFERARQWETKAIEMAASHVTDATREELRSRLELYKHGKPYREGPKKEAGR
jgi:tetratricopeptide (TPR) repeat protein